MKNLAFLFLLTLAFIACAANSDAGEQKSRRITAPGIPECLHIGDVVEAHVSIDAINAENNLDLTVSSETGKVNATIELTNDRIAPIAMTFRGEKFGEDIVTLGVSGRTDIAPLRIAIRVLPSFEPPQDLSTHPTEKFSRVEPDAEGDPNNFFREIIFRWRPKQGVIEYGIQIFDAQLDRTQSIGAGAGADSKVAHAFPGESHYWQIHAKIETCDGSEAWTDNSPMIPFDA